MVRTLEQMKKGVKGKLDGYVISEILRLAWCMNF